MLELDNILSNKLKSSHVVFFYKKVIDECTKLLKFAISSSKQNCSLLTAATDLNYTEIQNSSNYANAFEKYFASCKIQELSQTMILQKQNCKNTSSPSKIGAMRYISSARRNKNHKKLLTSFTRDSLAQTCAFHDVDFEIEQQIITAGTSSRIRKRALRDPSYDLKSILLDGRRAEQSEYQARDIESKEPSTDGLHKVHTTPKRTTTCRNCRGIYPHEGQCPAKGKQCRKCGKCNHFAKVCRRQSKFKQNETKSGGKHPQKPINPIDRAGNDTDSSDED